MKRSFLYTLLGIVALATSALAVPVILIGGTPHPTNNSTFVNITNNAAADYAKGTDFQSVPVAGGPVLHRLKIRNIGSDILTYTVTDNSSQFRAINTGKVLVPITGERIFDIEFDPTSIGLKTAVLTITSNDPSNPTFRVNLRGTGTAPEADIFGGGLLDVLIDDGDTTPVFTDGTAYGSRDIFGGGDSRFFRLENNGSSDLQFIGASITSGQGFTLSSLPAAASFIGPGLGHNFIITFNPSSTGPKSAVVTVLTDDPNEGTYNFTVSGTGTTTPDINVQGFLNGTTNLANIIRGSTNPQIINGTDFGNVEVGESFRNIIRVSNTGTASLDFTPSESSSQFRISGVNQTSLPFGANGFEDFFIHFEPTSPGEKTATITITNNDPDEDPYNFTVRGFATAPEVTILGDTDFSEVILNGDTTPRVGDGTDFLNVAVNGPTVSRTFRIKNDGTSPLTFLNANLSPTGQGFSITKPAANTTILPLGYEEITVHFIPSTDGQVTTTVVISTTDANENPTTFNVTANGVGDPDILIKGNYVGFNDEGDPIPSGTLIASESLGTQFGEVELGNFNANRFLLKNVGEGTLNYTASVTGTEFSFFELVTNSSQEPNVNGANFDQDFYLVFEPTSRGTKSAIVTFTSNDPDTPSYFFVVEGTAVDPEMDLYGGDNLNLPISDGSSTPTPSTGTDFGSRVVNEPGETHTFLIYNAGERDLVIANGNNGLADDTHFTLTGMPTALQPIAPLSSATFQITFEPQSAGTHTTTLQIISNDDNENPYNFTIRGTGLNGPEMVLLGGPANTVEIPDGHSTPSTADSTDFGSVEVGQTVTRTYWITNQGNKNLTVTRPTVGGDFEATYSGNTATPGNSLTMTVTFTPDQVGTQVVFISIPNNDADENPYSFAVRGVGTASTAPADIEVRNSAGTLVIAQNNTPSSTDGTDIGAINVGGSLSRSFTLHNTGALNLTSISATPNNGATVSGLASSVPAASSDAFTVSLPTTTPGIKTATISIASNDPDENPYVFNVKGTVLPTELPPVDLSFNGNDGQFLFQTIAGLQYQIKASTTLQGQWDPIGNPITGNGIIDQILIPNLIDPNLHPSRKFFRLEIITP